MYPQPCSNATFHRLFTLHPFILTKPSQEVEEYWWETHPCWAAYPLQGLRGNCTVTKCIITLGRSRAAVPSLPVSAEHWLRKREAVVYISCVSVCACVCEIVWACSYNWCTYYTYIYTHNYFSHVYIIDPEFFFIDLIIATFPIEFFLVLSSIMFVFQFSNLYGTILWIKS